MNKDKKNHQGIDWYEFWNQQSQGFFSAADQHLKDLFSKHTFVNPETHAEQIQQWLDSLKSQWQQPKANKEQKQFQEYWELMAKLYTEASQTMMDAWIKRTRENDPITNIRELYELWLDSCHQVYQKALKSKAYQDIYAEWMNATVKFWSQMGK